MTMVFALGPLDYRGVSKAALAPRILPLEMFLPLFFNNYFEWLGIVFEYIFFFGNLGNSVREYSVSWNQTHITKFVGRTC